MSTVIQFGYLSAEMTRSILLLVEAEVLSGRLAVATGLLLFPITVAPHSTERPPICKGSHRVVDACFTVHGRYSYYNGNPSFRIWVIGTHRLLGVKDDESPIIPKNLETSLGQDLFADAVYGDFEVCPFTHQRPHAMQMVCVESATHLIGPDGNPRK